MKIFEFGNKKKFGILSDFLEIITKFIMIHKKQDHSIDCNLKILTVIKQSFISGISEEFFHFSIRKKF